MKDFVMFIGTRVCRKGGRMERAQAIQRSVWFVGILLMLAGPAFGANYVQNGDFSGGLTNWAHVDVTGTTTPGTDNVNFGNAAPSLSDLTGVGDKAVYEWYDWQTISQTINSTDTVYLSLWWRKIGFVSVQTAQFNISVEIRKPSGATATIWTDASTPNSADVAITGMVTDSLVSSFFDETGTYDIRLRAVTQTGRDKGGNASLQINWDDVVLDVRVPAANNAPTVTAGATTASPATINRIGTNATTLSASFSDADAPGIGAFNVTFRVREPDNSTVVDVAVNSPNGSNGVTITDDGGGNYTATVDWDPGDTQTRGLYDLYFEVSDGTDNAIDTYTNNLDELTVTSQATPSFTASITAVSPDSVNRAGTDSTRLSATWTDPDQQPVDSFWVTFSVREPDNATEVLITDSLVNGSGGLTVVDNGNGTYSAYVDWDPGASQVVGLYDLRCRVFDGTAAAEDGYTANLDELTVYETVPNNPPTITAGAPSATPSSVNRIGTGTTQVACAFSDLDAPAVSTFVVSIYVRHPDNVTVDTLVQASTNGQNGLTVASLGGSNYEASVNWDPPVTQPLGAYDIQVQVSDGIDAATDPYANNLDELTVYSQSAPTLTPGVTAAAPDSVNRAGTSTSELSVTWSDADSQPVDSFWVTFSVREPDNTTEVIAADSLTHGQSGMTITDNGDGTYTARFNWDPSGTQTLGLYDLQARVFDGTSTAQDVYASNLNELTVYESVPNAIPVIAAGAATASPLTVNRIGTDSTRVQVAFHDDDIPGVAAFYITLRVREPDDATQISLIVAGQAGTGGLVIQDLGAGDYLAYLDWNPPDNQTTGLYDIYAGVSDETDFVEDPYTNNLNELTVQSVAAPTISAGATIAVPDSVNRIGTASTLLRVTFADPDAQPVSAFHVTFKVRQPDNTTEVTIADSLTDGVGGMSIVDNGNGTYTASYSWNPADAQTTGLYDLYSQVADDVALAIDGYTNNLDELNVYSKVANSPPTFTAGAATATPSGVDRIGTDSTRLSITFTDTDVPGVSAFVVTFKVREPDNASEVIVADHLNNGVSGMTITDGGAGSYTAYFDWNPADVQTLGSYDLYAQVSDGLDSLTDSYGSNPDELTVLETSTGSAPVISTGVTNALPDSLNRTGASYTFIRVDFTDADQHSRKAFLITFKVRDASSVEYTLANALTDDSVGMTVLHLDDSTYRAEIKWDPADAQPLGLYDLYALVEDPTGQQALDDYAANTDELQLYAENPAGDGRLLRRGMSAASCGDSNQACHNVLNHDQTTTGSAYSSWTTQPDCLTCHTPHNTQNLYLIRDSINTPNSGTQDVILKNLGQGDPYNPDPAVGDPTSGVLGDATDGVFTGACEVCHTQTKQHRNTTGAPVTTHYNGQNCTSSSCHQHGEGFKKPANAESNGGNACGGCHNAIYSPMNTSTSSYHHQLNTDNPDYDVTARACLMCHVDHNIFRPDLNTGFGARGSNLRVDTSTTVVQGSAAVLANSDYLATGSGGICLSCHVNSQTKSYTQPDGTTQTPVLSKADYDAATTAHNYSTPSTFASDASTFNANCVKCHNDSMNKGFQSSTNKFSTHNSSLRRILAELGLASPADPIEEEFCYNCHSTTSNPNAGGGNDWYNTQAMSATALAIESMFSKTYAHGVAAQEGVHKPIESAADFAAGATRHVECMDCHNPHAATTASPLKGTWGVQPTAWPAAPTTMTDNANTFATPASYTVVNSVTEEWQLCLKCHSNYTTLPGGSRNIAAEINPNYRSQHGIAPGGTRNPACDNTTMLEPWASTGRTKCSDCHRSDTPTDPGGPHGSNQDHMLVATITSNSTVGTPLCYTCHNETTYWSDRNAIGNSRYGKHPSVQGSHQAAPGCFTCHMWDYATTGGLGVSTTDWPVGAFGSGDAVPPVTIWVHGMNRKWVFRETDGTAGSQEISDAFANGYLADINFATKQCWAENCKNHSPQSY